MVGWRSHSCSQNSSRWSKYPYASLRPKPIFVRKSETNVNGFIGIGDKSGSKALLLSNYSIISKEKKFVHTLKKFIEHLKSIKCLRYELLWKGVKVFLSFDNFNPSYDFNHWYSIDKI